MIIDHEEEMKALNLKEVKGESNEEYYGYIKNKINEYLEKNVLKNYKNIFMSDEGCIIRYNDESEYLVNVFRTYFYEYPISLNIVEKNKSDSKSSNFYNKSNSFEEFDEAATLSYSISGGNHFVPGIKSNKLYYYELKIGDSKPFKFKSSLKLKRELSFDNTIVVSSSNTFKKYKISIP